MNMMQTRTTVVISIYAVVLSYFAATSGEEGTKALMREIGLGKLFGESEQPNIVKFIGCVTAEGKVGGEGLVERGVRGVEITCAERYSSNNYQTL